MKSGGPRRSSLTLVRRSGVALVCCAAALAGVYCTPTAPDTPEPSAQFTEPVLYPPAVQQVMANANFAPPVGRSGALVKIDLPAATRFQTKSGRSGWRIAVPGGRPLATPAVVDGMLFVGGGFASHEFYALDAKTGARVWTFRTGDDGPTAAVVGEGCVAYNTESCTIYVHDARDGKVLWYRWLGDPLMSHPAIADGRVFMAYPGKDGRHHLAAFELRTGKPVWDRPIAAEVISAPVVEGTNVYAATADGSLYCFSVDAGEARWSTKCNVTSAPRVVDGRLLISQRAVKTIEISAAEGEGAKKQTSESTVEGYNVVDAKTGELAHAEPVAAVKAAYLMDIRRGMFALSTNSTNFQFGQVAYQAYASKAHTVLNAKYNGNVTLASLSDQALALSRAEVATDAQAGTATAQKAIDLAQKIEEASAAVESATERRTLVAAAKSMKATAVKSKDAALTAKSIKDNLSALKAEQSSAQAQDASVGFAQAPSAAKLELANSNLGVGNVKSVWAYQGSRPCPFGKSCISVRGATCRAVDPSTGATAWEKTVGSTEKATRPATPPALAGGKLYLGTTDGTVLCLDARDGRTLWEEKVGGRIIFEPTVVGGSVYVATDDGMLVCLETGDTSADGWSMWGGSARHNGP